MKPRPFADELLRALAERQMSPFCTLYVFTPEVVGRVGGAGAGVRATVAVDSKTSGPRDLPLDAFLTGPGKTALAEDELVVGVAFDRAGPNTSSVYMKEGLRNALAIAIVSVAMVFDEISLENNVLRSIPLFDIERVEVLKGPQGSLFGRNTNAGAIKIDSVKPGLERNGYFRASYGVRDSYSLEGASNLVMSETFSMRASLKYQERGDWIDNIYNGPGDDFGAFDETAWRLQAIWNATDSFSAYLKLHGFSQDGSHPNVFYANAIEVGKPGLRPGFDEEIANHDNDVATLELDHVGGALNLQWVFGNGMTLTSITGYDTVDNFQSADVDGGEVSFDPADLGALGRQLWFNVATGDGLTDHDQLTQELRLAAESDRLF